MKRLVSYGALLGCRCGKCWTCLTKKRLTQYGHWLFFVTLALVIMGPLLQKGYILALDMVFGPVSASARDLLFGFEAPVLGARLLPELLLAVAGALGPVWLVQKIILLSIFTLAGIGAYRLPPVPSRAARYYAGLLYGVNPFVYVRFLAGHWYILVSYAVVPFAVKSFISLLERPSLKQGARVLALTSLVAISSHLLALTAIVYLVLYLFWVVQRRSAPSLHLYVAGLVPAFFLLNAYWLMPALTADRTLLQAISELDLDAFAPVTVVFSPWVSIALMLGFWREGYVYAVNVVPAVGLAFGVIVWVAIYGASWTYRSWLTMAVFTIGVIGFVLGSGVAGPFEGLFRFLALHFPFFEGFRDSHKFVLLLVLAYALLGAHGVDAVVAVAGRGRAWQRRLALAAIILVFLAPLAYSFTLFWGFNGYVKATSYPEDWYTVRRILKEDAGDYGILVLPWESYMPYPWVPNRDSSVRTPARNFFEGNLIYPKQVIRRGGIYAQSFAPEQPYIKSLLAQSPTFRDLGARLRPLAVKYVVLEKGGRQLARYNFLYDQQDLELVLDGETIALFRNRHPVSRVYVSSSPDLSGGLEVAQVARLSHVRYRIEAQGDGYLVVVPPNYDIGQWRLDGQPSMSPSPGFYGVFPATGGGVLAYRPFSKNVVWYSVSAASLFMVLSVPLMGRARWGRWVWSRYRAATRTRS